MATQLAASIYGANQNSWNKPQGLRMSFSTASIVIRELETPTQYSGVTCVTAIQVLPTAPSVIQPVYYTAATVADLVTAANT